MISNLATPTKWLTPERARPAYRLTPKKTENTRNYSSAIEFGLRVVEMQAQVMRVALNELKHERDER